MAKKKPIISSLGQWAYPGEVTIIPSSKITMKGVNYPVLGVDDFGNSQVMMPGAEYEFPGNYVTEYPQMGKGGEMIKRKDGSYSKRGLWDNIRANKGSGKKPTKQMLEQERKIKAKMQDGGWLNNYPKSKVILPSVSQPELNPIAMTGLMKSKIAYADAFNNPTGARLTNRDSKSYTFTSDDEYNGGAPQGSQGNVYMSSYGEYATPQIQDVNGRLQFLADPWSPENVQRSLNQSIIFNEPDEAQYFGEHYKEVAPMMQSWNKKKNGGALNKSVTCSNCGWSWKLSEGGSDPLTCHKCGGIAKLQNGAQYTPAPDNRIYSDNARVTRSQPNNNSTPNIISLMPNIEKSSYGLLDKPQLKMMEVYSGKEQKPSEYLQSRTYNNPIANAFYKNKAVGVAADLVFDPLNILPTAILSKFKTLPGTVDKLNEIKKFYNTSKNLVQRADNVSDFSELVGMQEGGWLQQYQKGAQTLPPIYTSNPNDYNIRRYNDSLDLYNKTQPSFDRYKKWTKLNNIETSSMTGGDLFRQYMGNRRPADDSPYNLGLKSWIKPVEEMWHSYMRPRPVPGSDKAHYRHLSSKDANLNDYLKPNPNPNTKYNKAVTRYNASIDKRDLIQGYNPEWEKERQAVLALRKNTWDLTKTKQDFLDLGLYGVTPKYNSLFRFQKPVQPYVYRAPNSTNVENINKQVVPEVEVQPINTQEVAPKVEIQPTITKEFISTPATRGKARITKYEDTQTNKGYERLVQLDNGESVYFADIADYNDWEKNNDLDWSRAQIKHNVPYSADKGDPSAITNRIEKARQYKKQTANPKMQQGGWLKKYQTAGPVVFDRLSKVKPYGYIPDLSIFDMPYTPGKPFIPEYSPDIQKYDPIEITKKKSLWDKIAGGYRKATGKYDKLKYSEEFQDAQLNSEIRNGFKNYDPQFRDSLIWTLDYMNSPNYKRNLMMSAISNVDRNDYSNEEDYNNEVQGQFNHIKYGRLNNLKTTPNVKSFETGDADVNSDGINTAGWSESDSGQIRTKPMLMSAKNNDDYNWTNSTMYPHEISHSVDRPNDFADNFGELDKREIPEADLKEMSSRLKIVPTSTYDKYYAEPSEVRARLNATRKHLSNKGVDVFTKPLTIEDLNITYPDGFIDDGINQLRNIYKDEDILWMLNNISKNEEPKLNIAKNGGWLNKYQTAGEVSTEQNPEKMNPIEIQTERKPWYERLPRQIGNRIGLDPYHLDDKDFGSQFRQRVSDATGGADWYKQSNPFMNLALETMNVPQLAATYGVTGKVQTPSEAMDIQNPYGAFAVDMLLDPAVAFGLTKGLVKGAPLVAKYAKTAGKKLGKSITKDVAFTPTINNFSKFDELTPQSMDDIYHRVVNSPGYSDDVQKAIDYWQEYKHVSPELDKSFTLELGEDLPLTRRLKTPLAFDENGYVINSGKPISFSAGLGNDLLGQHRVHLMAPKGTKVSPISRAASSTTMQGEREVLFPTTSKFKKLHSRVNPQTGLEDYIIGLEQKNGGQTNWLNKYK